MVGTRNIHWYIMSNLAADNLTKSKHQKLRFTDNRGKT